MSYIPRTERLRLLREELLALRRLALTHAYADAVSTVDPVHAHGAVNLAHYVSVRRRDLRALQERLSAEGLSSLGRMEPDVLGNIEAVLGMIDAACGASVPDGPGRTDTSAALHRNAAALLGGSATDHQPRIMVTLPSDAADDPDLVARFAAAGMDVARINAAHDDPEAWRCMATAVRRADDGIRIAMDLAGPKLRTGSMPERARVLKIRPRRDDRGRVIEPARLTLVGDDGERDATSLPPATALVPGSWLENRTVGDRVRLRDARDRRRELIVTEVDTGRVVLEGDRTAYLEPGTVLDAQPGSCAIGDLPPRAGALLLTPGDLVEVHGGQEAASSRGSRHRVGCSLPEALDALRVGHRVLFDDGMIEGVVREVTDAAPTRTAVVEITHTAASPAKLRAEKGINLPDTDLPIPALTVEDLAALAVAIEIADIVQLSFVRTAADVRRLFDELDARGADHLGVVVKIETVRAFQALPEILLELMRRPRVGVMIARGDLGVEAGWERLAEVQEEILWLCEAAHIPAIWATQVLDTLAGSGVPTRAEVTDAAAGERAECVMLNKGPHIEEAIRALDDILGRMRGHLDKKRPLLRRLRAFSGE